MQQMKKRVVTIDIERQKIDCLRFVMYLLLAPGFQGFFFSFLMWPLTVLMKQTRQQGCAIKQSILLRCLWLLHSHWHHFKNRVINGEYHLPCFVCSQLSVAAAKILFEDQVQVSSWQQNTPEAYKAIRPACFVLCPLLAFGLTRGFLPTYIHWAIYVSQITFFKTFFIYSEIHFFANLAFLHKIDPPKKEF